jgi:outer membrane protein OmpA-like peptidoglycan-associated protein
LNSSRILAGFLLCLTLGVVDLLYLNLRVLPLLWAGPGSTSIASPVPAQGSGPVPGGGLNASPAADQDIPEVLHQTRAEPLVEPAVVVLATETSIGPETIELPRELVLSYGPRQFALTLAHRSELNAVLKHIKDPMEVRVEIDGHSDSTGSATVDNVLLSRKRADAVAAYLLEQGIPKERIVSQGHGAIRPIVKNNTPAAWERNRRTEVRFFKDRS